MINEEEEHADNNTDEENRVSRTKRKKLEEAHERFGTTALEEERVKEIISIYYLEGILLRNVLVELELPEWLKFQQGVPIEDLDHWLGVETLQEAARKLKGKEKTRGPKSSKAKRRHTLSTKDNDDE